MSEEKEQEKYGAVIYWWNFADRSREYEEFDSMQEALKELEKWKAEYPWNTYHVAQVTLIHGATEEWKDPIQYRVLGYPTITTAEWARK